MVKLSKLYLILIFFISAFIRFFVGFKYYFLHGDLLIYLTLAKNFPCHLYFNKSFYLFHPPMYAYIIGIFNFFINNDYIAGILVSFFFFLVSFIVLVKLFFLLKKSIYWVCVFMLFFTFNLRLFFFSTLIMRELMVFALFWLTIFFFIKGLKKSDFNFIYSGIFGAMLVLTSDLAVTILPIFILTFLFFYNKKKIVPALFSFLSALTAYLFWLLLKLKVYLGNIYYPIMDGFIENVNNFNIFQLYSPALFPLVSSFASYHSSPTITLFLKHIRYFFTVLLNLIPPFNIPMISPSLFGLKEYLLLIFIYIPIIFFISLTIIKTIINLKKFKIYNNASLYFILLSIILLLPIMEIGSVPRHSIQVIAVLIFFITEGIFIFLNKLKLLKIMKYLPLVIILLLFLLPFWIINNPYPITSLKSETIGSDAADYINILDGDGVMALNVPIAYLTDKREIPLYPNPEKLNFFIELYNITYIVFNFNEDDPYLQFHKRTFDYIFEHPEKYKLLKTIEENYNRDYDLVPQNNKFYVFLVK